MKNLINTQSNLAKFMVAASFFAIGCTAIGGTALASEPLSRRGTRGTLNGQLVGDLSRALFGP